MSAELSTRPCIQKLSLSCCLMAVVLDTRHMKFGTAVGHGLQVIRVLVIINIMTVHMAFVFYFRTYNNMTSSVV